MFRRALRAARRFGIATHAGAAIVVAGSVDWPAALAQAPSAETPPAASSAAADRPTDSTARDIREEIQRVPVTLKDLYGREETRPMLVTIFRPPGDGPFPLAIMNHGRAVESKRALQGRQRYEDLSRYFVSKGFVVMLPTRVGYAETYGDFDPEATGNCNARRLEPMAEAVFEQVMATRAFAATLHAVDASRWIVVGQSAGGFTSVVTVGRRPPGLVAGINFAGGSGGDPDNRPQQPCSPQAVERIWSSAAGSGTAPMLWLYWQNDQYWGPDIPKGWNAAWNARGGRAEMRTFPAAGKDGHAGSSIDMDHWVPAVDAFLGGLGFTKPGIVPRPAPSPFAALADIDKVPTSQNGREDGYSKFLDSKMPRAFAIGRHGAWGWATGDWALGKAIGRCERRGEACKLYAVDDAVVWVP